MKMDRELVERLRRDQPVLRAWGEFIRYTIAARLDEVLSAEQKAGFLKIAPQPRVKSPESLVDKALYRGKAYVDAYSEITDKVGLRYVVLLQGHLAIIEEIIKTGKDWLCSKDRDFIAMRKSAPEFFDYESVHYVLTAKRALRYSGQRIPKGTACEVQLRTLLQHALAELTHDTIYKSKTKASPGVRRVCARARALSETTDNLFIDASKKIQKTERKSQKVSSALFNLYAELLDVEPVPTRANDIIVDALEKKLESGIPAMVKRYFQAKPHLLPNIRDNTADSLAFRQPAILAAYYFADHNPNWLRSVWPIQEEPLRKIFLAVGRAYD